MIFLGGRVMAYKGIGASPGVALGKALVVEHSELVIEKIYR